MSEMIPVTCVGDFFYVENRNKNYRSYEVEVQLPREELDRALWYIKKYLIAEAVQGEHPELAFAGVRTCAIKSHLPSAEAKTSGGDVVEDMDEVQEDMFADAETVVEEDSEFGDVGEVIG